MRLAALLLGVLLAAPGWAQEEVVADMSQNRISINADFAGSEILIFGAVKRETRIDYSPLGIIITVAGPPETVVVRRKARVAGIWANTASVEIDRAPSFYAVATSAPLDEILLQIEDLRYQITPTRAIRAVGAPQDIANAQPFTEALIRIREGNGRYDVEETIVALSQQTLFSTSVELPSNLVEGNYTVRIFLTRDRRIVNAYSTTIFVRKVGLERFLYTLAQEQPVIYGLMSLALAGIAGWGASAAFRLIRS